MPCVKPFGDHRCNARCVSERSYSTSNSSVMALTRMQGRGVVSCECICDWPLKKRINTLSQISDGRVLYSTQHVGETSVQSRVDLNRIREYLGPITTASLEDPVIAMYLAVGGQLNCFEKWLSNIAGRTCKPAGWGTSTFGGSVVR